MPEEISLFDKLSSMASNRDQYNTGKETPVQTESVEGQDSAFDRLSKMASINYNDYVSESKEIRPEYHIPDTGPGAGFWSGLFKNAFATMKYDVPGGAQGGSGAMVGMEADILEKKGLKLSEMMAHTPPVPGAMFANTFNEKSIPRLYTGEQKKAEIERLKDAQIEAVKVAQKYKEAGLDYRAANDIITSFDDVHDFSSFLSWAGSSTGNFAGQIIPSMLSGSAAILFLESGEIYDMALEKQSKETGLSKEELIRKDMDDPSLALAFGTLASALEVLGMGSVLNRVIKSLGKSSIRAGLLSLAKGGITESTTEGLQSIVEQYGAHLSSSSKKDFSLNWRDVRDSAMSGLVGGFLLPFPSVATSTFYNKITKEAESVTEGPDTVGPRTAREIEADLGFGEESETTDILSGSGIESAKDQEVIVEEETGLLEDELKNKVDESVNDILNAFQEQEAAEVDVQEQAETGEEVAKEVRKPKKKKEKEVTTEKLTEQGKKKKENIHSPVSPLQKKEKKKEEKKEIYKERKEQEKEKEKKERKVIEKDKVDDNEINSLSKKSISEYESFEATISDGQKDTKYTARRNKAGDLVFKVGNKSVPFSVFRNSMVSARASARKAEAAKIKQQEAEAKQEASRAKQEVKQQPKEKPAFKYQDVDVENTSDYILKTHIASDKSHPLHSKAVEVLQRRSVERSQSRATNVSSKEESSLEEARELQTVDEENIADAEKAVKMKNKDKALSELKRLKSLSTSKETKDRIQSKIDGLQAEKKVEQQKEKFKGDVKAEEPGETTLSSIIKSQNKETTSSEKISIEDAKSLAEINRDIESGRLRDATSKLRRYSIRKSGDSEMIAKLIGEVDRTNSRLKDARAEEEKRFVEDQKKLEAGKISESDFKKKWQGTPSEQKEYSTQKKEKLLSIQEAFNELFFKNKVPSTMEGKQSTHFKQLRDKVDEFDKWMQENNRPGLDPDQKSNILTTGNPEGNIKIPQEYKEIKLSRIRGSREGSGGKKRVAKKKVDGSTEAQYQPSEKDFEDIEGYSDLSEEERKDFRDAYNNGEVDLREDLEFSLEMGKRAMHITGREESLFGNGLKIVSESAYSKRISRFLGGEENALRFINSIKKISNVLGKRIFFVQADSLLYIHKEKGGKFNLTRALGVTYKTDNAIIVSYVKWGNQTALHEGAHVLGQLLHESETISKSVLADAGFTKEQINAISKYVKKIEKYLNAATGAWEGIAGHVFDMMRGTGLMEVPSTKDVLLDLTGDEETANFLNNAIGKELYSLIKSYLSNFEFQKDRNKFVENAYLALYGLRNQAEFLAEIASNPDFAAFTMMIESTKSRVRGKIDSFKSIFYMVYEAMNEAVSKIFKISKSIIKADNLYNDVFRTMSEFEYEIFGSLDVYKTEKVQRYATEDANISLSIDHIEDGYSAVYSVGDILFKKESGKVDPSQNKKFAKEEAKRNKKIKEFHLKKLLNFLEDVNPTYGAYIDFVKNVNKKLPSDKQISGATIEKAFKVYFDRVKRGRDDLLRNTMNNAYKEAPENLEKAKDIIIDFAKKNIKKWSGYNADDINSLLDAIRNVNSLEKFLSYVDDMATVLTDIKYNKAFRTVSSNISKLSFSKLKSKVPVNEKNLFHRVKRIKLIFLNTLELEVLNEYITNFSSNITNLREFVNEYEARMRADNASNTEGFKYIQPEEKDENSSRAIRNFNVIKKYPEILRELLKARKNYKSLIEGRTKHQKDMITELLYSHHNVLNKNNYKMFYEALRYLNETGNLSQHAGEIILASRYYNRTSEFLSKRSVISKHLKRLSGLFANASETFGFSSVAQIVSEMSGMNRQSRREINKLFTMNIKMLDAAVAEEHRVIMSSINKKLKDLNLNLSDSIAVSIYSQIVATVSDPNIDGWDAYNKEVSGNIEKYRQSLKNAMQAAKNGEMSESRVKKEVDIFNRIVSEIKRNNIDGALSKKQRDFRDFLISITDSLYEDFAASTQAFTGKPFQKWYQYLPTKVIGNIHEKTGKSTTEKNAELLASFIDSKDPKLSEWESGHSRERGFAKGVYYDNDITSVMNSYVRNALYDTYVLPEVMVLNKVFRDSTVEEVVTKHNMDILKKSLKKTVQRGRGNIEVRMAFIRGMEAVKNIYVTGRIGSVTQLGTQLLTTIPSIYILKPKGFTRATKTLMKAASNKEYRAYLKEWIRKNGHGLQNRDVMFETFDAMLDDSSFNKGYKHWVKTAQDITTYTLRKADSLAAIYTFLSSYYDVNGTLENPDVEKISFAEMETDLLQNISNPRFTSNIMRPNSEGSRGLLSFLFVFKSFQINQSVSSYLGLSNLDEADARSLAVAVGVNQLAYYTFLMATLSSVSWGAYLLASWALDGDDREKWKKSIQQRDEELTKGFWWKTPVRAVADILFGWLPVQFEDVITKSIIDKRIAPFVKERILGLDYDKEEDLLFFSQKMDSFGGYEAVNIATELFVDSPGLIYDTLAGERDEELGADWLIFIGNVMLFAPFVPLRGDISKFLKAAGYSAKNQDSTKSDARFGGKWGRNNSKTFN